MAQSLLPISSTGWPLLILTVPHLSSPSCAVCSLSLGPNCLHSEALMIWFLEEEHVDNVWKQNCKVGAQCRHVFQYLKSFSAIHGYVIVQVVEFLTRSSSAFLAISCEMGSSLTFQGWRLGIDSGLLKETSWSLNRIKYFLSKKGYLRKFLSAIDNAF